MMIARTTSLALLLTATAPALGDDAPEPVLAEGEADGAILAYPASFFTEFSPVTARDMINRLHFLHGEIANERAAAAHEVLGLSVSLSCGSFSCGDDRSSF